MDSKLVLQFMDRKSRFQFCSILRALGCESIKGNLKAYKGSDTEMPLKRYGGIAQLGEHLLCKQGVKGSNPFISTIWADSSAG